MQELIEITTNKINSMTLDGTIEQMVSDNIEKAITSAIEDTLRSYSGFGKLITEKVGQAMETAGHHVELPEYNLFIKDLVERKYVEAIQAAGAEQLSTYLANILEPVQKEATTSSLIRKLEELVRDDYLADGHTEIDIAADNNTEGTALYVTINDPLHYTKIKVTFYNFNRDNKDTWHIGYINEDGTNLTGRVTNKSSSSIGDISTLFYKYYAMGTEFTMDEEFYSISLCD
jgi:hypothetical protein